MSDGLEEFQIPPEQIAEIQAKQTKVRSKKSKAFQPKTPWRLMPFDLLAAKQLGNIQLAILMELSDLSYSHHKANPVKFSNGNLGDIGINRSSKSKALKKLMEVGLIGFEKPKGKCCPLVTLNWVPMKAVKGYNTWSQYYY